MYAKIAHEDWHAVRDVTVDLEIVDALLTSSLERMIGPLNE